MSAEYTVARSEGELCMEMVNVFFTFVVAMLGFVANLSAFSGIQAINDRRQSHPVDDKAF